MFNYLLLVPTMFSLGCVVFSEQWWLFRKVTLASSTELEALGYSPDESIHQNYFILLFLNFKTAFLLMKKAIFKHGDREVLTSCVKALNFCATEKGGELDDLQLSRPISIESLHNDLAMTTPKA
ncbi:hypothetical protein H5410_027596 [Solanum commersonii]|uniref:Cohesin subunit SCC3/SA HEAT-repeats domain-containing protein n=1 Tax=Solanum commersonii TaxID=4109 RepID=A0A9J5Z2B6_SOLCO|nr:hypothetical protein H5410_027596 [Solanum commersonii]